MQNLNDFKKHVAEAEVWLRKEFQQTRTGQASPAILDGVRVEVYGAPLSLKEIASVTLEGARTLRVAPWDKDHIKAIEKAISVANLGLSVVVDAEGLRINFPAMTAESRAQVVRMAKDKLEEARKQVRRGRDDFMKEIQDKEKAGGMGKDEIFQLKNNVQKIVDEENKKLEDLFGKKEKEILS